MPETDRVPRTAPQTVQVSDVRFIAAPPSEVETGLSGWACFVVNGVLRLDGVAVRRTLNGRRTISFPARRDSAGRMHKYVRPANSQVAREIEHAVLRELGFDEP